MLDVHYDRLHALCRRMLGNDADALDATQEAMVAAVRSIARFDGRSALSTWLHRIAVNVCIDELRRRRRRPLQRMQWRGRGAASPVEGLLDVGAPAADHVDRVVAHIDVDGALQTLAPELRAAVVLRDLCDHTYADIADMLDIPPGTVRSRIARGRALLAGHLAERAEHVAGDAVAAGGARDASGNQRAPGDVESWRAPVTPVAGVPHQLGEEPSGR